MDPTLLVAELNKVAATLPQDVKTRQTLYEAARHLMLKTENLHELTHRILFSQALITVARVAVDLDLFKIITAQNGKACTVSDLAQKTGAEERLLIRVLRGLAANGLVTLDSRDAFRANAATEVFAADNTTAATVHNSLNVGPCMQVLPEYLKKTQYRSPVDTSNGPFQMAFNTSMPLFVWLGEHPENLQAAIGTMSGQRTDQLVWMAEEDLFPRSDFQLSEDDLARERTLVVDVGGGGGQQSITFRRSQPQLRGRVVLQDLQPTLDSIDSASRQQLKDLAVDIQGHDFFTPQPEKGAKVYYIRNILHDWPDDKCLIILKHLRDAMKSDSVLIIDEIVVNEDKINWKQFHYDIVMMACLAGEERTESHFETLLSSAGFKLRETRCYEDGNGDSFLICVPI